MRPLVRPLVRVPALMVLLFFFYGEPEANAQDQARTSRPPAYRAKTVSEEGYFFSEPSLDGEVLAVLPPGTDVWASRKVYGDFVRFRRVRFKGQMGYMPEIDVTLPSGRRPKTPVEEPPLATRPSPRSQEENPFVMGSEDFVEPQFPALFRNGVGPTLSLLSGRPNIYPDLEVDQWAAGVKLTGPGWFWKGPIADFDVAFAFPQGLQGAPSSITGYSVLADFSLQFPFYLQHASHFTLRVGPSLVFNDFKSSQTDFELRRWDLGLALAPVFSKAFGAFQINIGTKYHWNGAPFWGHSISLQYLFPESPDGDF